MSSRPPAEEIIPALLSLAEGREPEDGATWRPPFVLRLDGDAASGLTAALSTRRSVETFAPAEVPASVLREVCDRALDWDAAAWGQPGAIEFAALCRTSTEGVDERLVTRFHTGGDEALGVVELSDPSAISPYAGLARAPAILVVLGDVERACRENGARGYRQLLTRAGFAAHVASLHALAQGCATRSFRGFHRRPLQGALGRERELTHRQLMALAVGRSLPTG